MKQSKAINLNPVLSVDKDGVILYSNKAGEPLLRDWGVGIGEKLPLHIKIFVQRAISQEAIEKTEIKMGKRAYFLVFHFLPEQEYVNIYVFDITNRKKLEGKLQESETQENKNLGLTNIIDVKAVQSLMNDFYTLAHIPMALLDLKGNILVSVGWQDICSKFHRTNPETLKHCLECDINMSMDVAPGGYKLYKCKNNIWDVVTPVMVEGQHIGNIFSGQFFLDNEPFNYELFRSQARKYGFNEEGYIKALEKVPRLSRKAVDTSMAFFMTFANMISQLSYSTIKLSQSLAERDAVVDALRESEKRERARSDELATVLDAVPVAVYITHDPQALQIAGNRLSYEWLRVPMGTNLSKSAPDGEKPEVFKLFKNGVEIPPEKMPSQLSAKGIEINDCELDIVSADGEVRHVLGNARPLRDEQGNLRGSISAFIDITERKRAEETIRLSNIYNRSLIEASLDPLITIGRDGKITDVNNATERVTGYSRNELIETDFSDYFTEPEKARKGYQQVFVLGEVRDYPLEIRHRDGHITPILYNASVFRDENGEIIGVFAAARDITERKRHEMNLAFLAEIDEDFAHLSSVDEIMQTVGEKVGKYLKVKTVNFCEVDDTEGTFTVSLGWQDMGVPSLLHQTFLISNYLTEEFGRAGRAGETVIIRNTQTDPRTNARAYTSLDIGSVMIVPFHVKGKWKAFLSVTDMRSRDWLQDEIELFQELSNRIFPRIERAKAKEALRKSEERFRALVTASSEVVYRVSSDWSEMRHLYGRGFLANTESPSRNWLQEYVPLEDQQHVMAVINEAIRTKSIYQMEHRVRLADGSVGWIFSRAVPMLGANGEIIEWFGAASDITERKRVEEELRKSEERLRLLSDNLPDSAVYQYVSEPDDSARFVYFSAGIERLNGIKVSDLLRDPGTLHRQILPEYFERLVEAEARSARDLSDFDMELPMRLPNGKIRWMRLHSRPRRLPDGRTIWDGVQTDITELKQAEEVLRENELRSKVTEAVIAERQRFFDVLETLPVMIALLTPDHQITFANRYFREKFGESGDNHCFKYCFGRTRPCEFCEAHKVLETGKPHRWETTTSEGCVIDIYNFPFTDVDGSPLILEMDIDITERKTAEERLRVSEEKYRNIVETANEVILITDNKAVINYVNPKITDMLGYPLEEITGKPIWSFISEECKPVVRRNLEKRRKGISESYELKLIRKDGSPIWTFLNVKPLFDRGGKYAGAMSMLTDITKRKEAEEALANIETARKKEIHHRIKNNLQVISSLLDLQAEQFRNREDIKDSEVLEAFRESQDRVISMALIHEELYRGGGFETLNFSPYIQELAENLLLTYRLGSTDVSLNIDLEENLLLDMDTAVPLGMIVNELVSNSLKHAFPNRKKGEIRIKLSREENEEYMKSMTEDSKSTSFILTVSDDGVGIPENLNLEELDSLGFQLVTSLVDQLDGEFELKRKNGAEFTIRFTVVEKDSLAQAGLK
ncbi:PAS domain S-box protein [Methanosarcina sp.]|uniref:PAS domain S-box protein n=1 Tax=Methanosarcina sp. TaxID=2213 RepID=UPI002ABA22BA|nr:PAS domain S-box protein [Methanosarcina sp.]MDY9927177.1 PAS domain S-box protein [Methanosarcina sp.]